MCGGVGQPRIARGLTAALYRAGGRPLHSSPRTRASRLASSCTGSPPADFGRAPSIASSWDLTMATMEAVADWLGWAGQGKVGSR